jgi:hypothetical protein
LPIAASSGQIFALSRGDVSLFLFEYTVALIGTTLILWVLARVLKFEASTEALPVGPEDLTADESDAIDVPEAAAPHDPDDRSTPTLAPARPALAAGPWGNYAEAAPAEGVRREAGRRPWAEGDREGSARAGRASTTGHDRNYAELG